MSNTYYHGLRLVRVVSLCLLLSACGGGSSPPPRSGMLDQNNNSDPVIVPEQDDNSDLSVTLERVFTNLTFSQPIFMLQAPGDSSRWFVVERAGRVRVFANTPAVSTFQTDFIDLRPRVNTSGEGGLLGMAFHPDFTSNGQVFLSWTQTGNPLVSLISRFTTVVGGSALSEASEEVILRLNQDFSNHNGGHIGFGPDDGYLYIGFGDGGSGGDPNNRAQDTTNLHGALLRVNVDAGVPYTIPADNPFAGNPVCTEDPNVSVSDCPEIYAWGLRNPWRWSFDAVTAVLWAADVGQNAWEEINQIARGGNYGWKTREGRHCFNPMTNCNTMGLIDPVAEYGHELGNSITGGYVYRGTALSGLAGDYVFGDFGSGRIWRLRDDTGGFSLDELIDSNLRIASFGQGHDGELYAIDIVGGGLYRLAQVP